MAFKITQLFDRAPNKHLYNFIFKRIEEQEFWKYHCELQQQQGLIPFLPEKRKKIYQLTVSELLNTLVFKDPLTKIAFKRAFFKLELDLYAEAIQHWQFQSLHLIQCNL